MNRVTEKMRVINRIKIPDNIKDINWNEIINLSCVEHIEKLFTSEIGKGDEYDDVLIYLKGNMLNHYAGDLSAWNRAVFARPGDTLLEYVNHKWEVAGKFGCHDM